jgi:dipeptidyl aminopeptidase/acylaminoacyl peptidase
VPLTPARPDIAAGQVGPTRMFAYKGADGTPLEGVLTLPPARTAKALPLVVMPHGGPLYANDEVGFDWWAQAFAAQGYAVLQPNYRGSGGHGLAFVHAGYGEWGRKMLTDMSDGVAALAAQGMIDPRRVCIVGASYGGYAALAGVTLQHGIYRCAVSYAGVADLPALEWWDLDRNGDDNEMIRYWRTAVKGDDRAAPALGAISPARHADAADAPILLIHGKHDTVVPIEQSRKMKGALEGAHKPVELIELPGQDHWLSDEAARIQMLKASVEFVEKNNPPG